MTPERYEIYFADLNPTIGSEISKVRPVVIISQNEMNRNLNTVVVCPLTSSSLQRCMEKLDFKGGHKNGRLFFIFKLDKKTAIVLTL